LFLARGAETERENNAVDGNANGTEILTENSVMSNVFASSPKYTEN